jgi:hypothetical protein
MLNKDPYYNTVYAKLLIYVSVSALSSLGNDLSHYTCHDSGFKDITPVHWFTIGLNLIIQGLIAWRAFIDGSAEKYKEYVERESKN